MEALSVVGLKNLMFIVPLVLLLHELEEWNIYDYHKKAYSEGVVEETRLGTRLWLLFLGVVGFVWTLVCYWIPDEMVAMVLFMLLVDFCLLNAIQHIGMTVKTRKYNPGFVLGGVVGLLVNTLMVLKISSDAIMPQFLLIGMLCLVTPGIIDAAVNTRMNRLPKMVVGILRFSQRLERLMLE